MERARQSAESELSRTREAYDRALTESRVVLLQQVAPDVDGFHVSTSMIQVLGWDPLAFLAPGILRGMVHPDDLAVFAVAFPPPGSLEATPGAGHRPDRDDDRRAVDAAGPLARDDLVVRFRTAAGEWAHVQLRPTGGKRLPGSVARGSLIDVTADEQRPSHLAPVRGAGRA